MDDQDMKIFIRVGVNNHWIREDVFYEFELSFRMNLVCMCREFRVFAYVGPRRDDVEGKGQLGGPA